MRLLLAELTQGEPLDAKVNRDLSDYRNRYSYYDYILQTFVSPSEHVRCNINDCKELPCGDFRESKRMNKTLARQVYFTSVSVKNIFTVAQALHVRPSLGSPPRPKPASKLIINSNRPIFWMGS